MGWWTEIITPYNRLLAQGRVTWLIENSTLHSGRYDVVY